MTKSLILVSHGRFCEELKGSTEMIMGPQDNIHAVALLPEEGPEEFTAKFEACVADFEDYIVFADLLGGTPCNTVSRLILEGRAIDLYAGMNLPMVIEFINNSPNVFRLLLRESSGTSQAFRTAAAREIKHFTDELSEYIARKNNYSQYIAYVQAEGMVTIVFTAGANALDMSKTEREQLKERLILQLRMLAKGTKHEARDRREID